MKEGVSAKKIYQVGDIMIDSLFFHMEEAEKSNILVRWGLQKDSSRISPYALLTIHRPSNADDRGSLTKILKGLEVISKKIPILFPVHPRTRKQLSAFGLQNKILFPDVRQRVDLSSPGFYGMDPLGYLDFVKLMVHSKLIFTDSGGIQEEAMMLNIPCLTLRNTTERPITITQGTNVLVWNDTQKIIREAYEPSPWAEAQGFRSPDMIWPNYRRWSFTYRRMTCSSTFPTVSAKYPSAQKLSPHRNSSSSGCSFLITRLVPPFNLCTTSTTLSVGFVWMIRWTWSSWILSSLAHHLFIRHASYNNLFRRTTILPRSTRRRYFGIQTRWYCRRCFV